MNCEMQDLQGNLCRNEAERTVNIHWDTLESKLTVPVHLCEHHYQSIHPTGTTEGE